MKHGNSGIFNFFFQFCRSTVLKLCPYQCFRRTIQFSHITSETREFIIWSWFFRWRALSQNIKMLRIKRLSDSPCKQREIRLSASHDRIDHGGMDRQFAVKFCCSPKLPGILGVKESVRPDTLEVSERAMIFPGRTPS